MVAMRAWGRVRVLTIGREAQRLLVFQSCSSIGGGARAPSALLVGVYTVHYTQYMFTLYTLLLGAMPYYLTSAYIHIFLHGS